VCYSFLFFSDDVGHRHHCMITIIIIIIIIIILCPWDYRRTNIFYRTRWSSSWHTRDTHLHAYYILLPRVDSMYLDSFNYRVFQLCTTVIQRYYYYYCCFCCCAVVIVFVSNVEFASEQKNYSPREEKNARPRCNSSISSHPGDKLVCTVVLK